MIAQHVFPTAMPAPPGIHLQAALETQYTTDTIAAAAQGAGGSSSAHTDAAISTANAAMHSAGAAGALAAASRQAARSSLCLQLVNVILQRLSLLKMSPDRPISSVMHAAVAGRSASNIKRRATINAMCEVAERLAVLHYGGGMQAYCNRLLQQGVAASIKAMLSVVGDASGQSGSGAGTSLGTDADTGPAEAVPVHAGSSRAGGGLPGQDLSAAAAPTVVLEPGGGSVSGDYHGGGCNGDVGVDAGIAGMDGIDDDEDMDFGEVFVTYPRPLPAFLRCEEMDRLLAPFKDATSNADPVLCNSGLGLMEAGSEGSCLLLSMLLRFAPQVDAASHMDACKQAMILELCGRAREEMLLLLEGQATAAVAEEVKQQPRLQQQLDNLAAAAAGDGAGFVTGVSAPSRIGHSVRSEGKTAKATSASKSARLQLPAELSDILRNVAAEISAPGGVLAVAVARGLDEVKAKLQGLQPNLMSGALQSCLDSLLRAYGRLYPVAPEVAALSQGSGSGGGGSGGSGSSCGGPPGRTGRHANAHEFERSEACLGAHW